MKNGKIFFSCNPAGDGRVSCFGHGIWDFASTFHGRMVGIES